MCLSTIPPCPRNPVRSSEFQAVILASGRWIGRYSSAPNHSLDRTTGITRYDGEMYFPYTTYAYPPWTRRLALVHQSPSRRGQNNRTDAVHTFRHSMCASRTSAMTRSSIIIRRRGSIFTLNEIEVWSQRPYKWE